MGLISITITGQEPPPEGAWLPKAECPFCGRDYQSCPDCGDHVFVDWIGDDPYFSIECCCGATYVAELEERRNIESLDK